MTRLIILTLLFAVGCNEKVKLAQTKVTVQCDTSKYLLQACSAAVENGDLRLYIDQRDSPSTYTVEISQKGQNFDFFLYQPTIIDCLFVAPQFRVLDQNLRLDKTSYKPGENVEGELELLALGQKGYFREPGEKKLQENWDTLHITGTFSARVE